MTLAVRNDLTRIIAAAPTFSTATLRALETLANARLITLAAALASLEVGETMVFAKLNPMRFLSAKTRARELLDDDTAKWLMRTTAHGVQVTRKPATWSYNDPGEHAGDGARFLAAMAPGDSAIGPADLFATPSTALPSTRKQSARTLLRDPNANWISRSTTKGVRVTRVR